MADNAYSEAVTVNGTLWHTDEVTFNSVLAHMSINKLAYGALNSATLVTTTNGLPVQVVSGQTIAVTNVGTFVTQENGAALTALQLIDDCIFTDDGTYTPGTSKLAVIGGEFDDTTPDSVDEGDAGAFRMSARREQYIQIRDAAGNERGLNVNASNAALVTQTGALPAGGNTIGDVTISGAALTALQAIDDPVLADDSAFTVGTSKVVAAGFLADETATDSVDEGDIGAPRMTLDRKAVTVQYAHTAGGWTPYKLNSAASTNATVVKGSAGQVGYVYATNTNAATRYLKFYDGAGSPTVGTDTPIHVIALPPSLGAPAFFSCPSGITFSNGITFAITTGAADSDTGAVAANEILVNLGYK